MQSEPVTLVLLREWRNGASSARDRLISRLHPELVQIAAARLRREAGSSFSSVDLVNDAVIRLLQIEGMTIADRAHFVALAARLMRNILVEHARAKGREKRRHVRVTLCTEIDGGQRIDLIQLETALIRLRVINPELVELVEMRFFGGMSMEEVAEVSGLSEATVKRRWRVARAWLAEALASPIDSD